MTPYQGGCCSATLFYSYPGRALRDYTTPFISLRLAVCRSRHGGPRIQSEKADANVDCAVAENTLFTSILDCEKSTEKNE